MILSLKYISVLLVFLYLGACVRQAEDNQNSGKRKNSDEVERLFFPSDQFDELMYVPRQSTTTSELDAEFEAILRDVRNANFEPLGRLSADDFKRIISKPIGLLKVDLNTGQYSNCTASVIDSNKILTNWHCLPKFGSNVTRAVLQMGFYDANNDQGVKKYSVDITPIESDRSLDYAILKVNGDLSEWGRVQLSVEVPPAKRSLTIVHHPAGLPKHITQRRCETRDPAIVQEHLAHFCDTLQGSSGAPIFFGSGSSIKVVALHFAGIPRSLAKFDPTYEYNRAVTVQSIAAKSQLIRSTIDRAAALEATTPSSRTALESVRTRLDSGDGIDARTMPAAAIAPIVKSEVSALDEFSVFKECEICPEMIIIPEGSFVMGSPLEQGGRDPDESPQQEKLISTFAVGRFEITEQEFSIYLQSSNRRSLDSAFKTNTENSRYPAAGVTWNDAQAYVAWLSRLTGNNYRLLSEAEWEYVARAKTNTVYWTGNSLSPKNANFIDSGYSSPIPVGSYKSNPFGLFDTSGNVWEWVEDCYRPYAEISSEPSTTSALEGCEVHVYRGGGWNDRITSLRSANRGRLKYNVRNPNEHGFRVARDL